MNVSFIHHIEKTFVNQMVSMKGKTILLYLVRLILKEDIILLKTLKNISFLLIYF